MGARGWLRGVGRHQRIRKGLRAYKGVMSVDFLAGVWKGAGRGGCHTWAGVLMEGRRIMLGRGVLRNIGIGNSLYVFVSLMGGVQGEGKCVNG